MQSCDGGFVIASEPPPTDEGFVAAVERVAEAGRRASASVEAAVVELLAACEAHRAGRALAQVVDDLIAAGGREMRLGVADAFLDYERAVASMRACVVRTLVEEDGLSLTAVAQRLKISRQAAARIYQGLPHGDDRASGESAG
jgi:hypothetical protein